MESATDFILKFKEHGWRMKPNPYSVVLELVEEGSTRLFDIADAALRELDDAPTFLVELLDHLDEEQLGHLAQIALELGGNALSASQEAVLSTIAYQTPQVLAPFLSRISELTDRLDDRFDPAWRAADANEIARLERLLENPEDDRTLVRVFETQRIDVIDHALASPPAMDSKSVQYWAYFSAYQIEDGRAKSLTMGPCHHLLFDYEDPDQNLPDDDDWPLTARMTRLHPTNNLASDADFRRTFGGPLVGECRVCGGTLHRLLDLSALPTDFGITAHRLTIGTCLSCLGWERPELFYEHQGDGGPLCINGDGVRIEPKFPAMPLQETIVHASPTPYRWREQRWGSRYNINRLGGRPTWIQFPDYPTCPACETTMPFLAQFDSGLRIESGYDWLWGSGGLAYVFWCDNCRISALKWQCT